MPTVSPVSRIEQAGFLHHATAAFEDAHLPFDFLIHRQFQEAEGVQILDLGLGAELFRALQADADVGVAAQMAFFHVAAGYVDVLQHLLDLR